MESDVFRKSLRQPFDAKVGDSALDCWPVLQDEAKRGLAWALAEKASENSEADPAAILFTMLTAAGALFGSDVYCNVSDTRHPPRLFIMVSGATAKARKGTSLGPVKRVLERCSTLLVGYGYPRLKESPGPFSSGEGIIHAVRDASEELKDNGEPKDPGVSDKRLLVTDSEISSLLTVAKRSGNTVSATVRCAWDSGDLEPLTKTNKEKTTDAHICVVGHITIDEFKSSCSSTELVNGLVNRFLLVCARRTKLMPLAPSIPDNLVDELAMELKDAVIASQRAKGSISFTPEARELYESAYRSTLSTDRTGMFGASTARGEAQVIRLALIYALLDSSQVIDVQHVEAALCAWKYCEDSAKFIFGEDPGKREEIAIVDALASGRPQRWTELKSKLMGEGLHSSDLDRAQASLQSRGVIVVSKESSSGRGRRADLVALNSPESK